jgi:serine/threonine protein kinase
MPDCQIFLWRYYTFGRTELASLSEQFGEQARSTVIQKHGLHPLLIFPVPKELSTLGRGSYEITGLLGKGGMGEVYRARDSKLKRDVATKSCPKSSRVIPSVSAASNGKRKFLRRSPSQHCEYLALKIKRSPSLPQESNRTESRHPEDDSARRTRFVVLLSSLSQNRL